MTTSEARRYLGSNYAISLILDVNRSTVGRWKEIPPEHVDGLRLWIEVHGLKKRFNGRKRR